MKLKDDYYNLYKSYLQKCHEINTQKEQYSIVIEDIKKDMKDLIRDMGPYLVIPHYFNTLDSITKELLPEWMQKILNDLPGEHSDILKEKWGL